MYLFQPTSTLACAVSMLLVLVRVDALPSSLTQRDLKNTETLELNVRYILEDPNTEKYAPNGKVTLTKAAAKWNQDAEWLVFDVVKGLVDGMTATATTRADGEAPDPEYIDMDSDTFLGIDYESEEYSPDQKQRWWMLESGKPEDITDAKELDIKLDGEMLPELRVVSDNDEEDNRDTLFFTIQNWRGEDDEEMCAATRATGGRIDPETLQRLRSNKKMVEYSYEEKEGYRRRWWVVSECD